MQNKYKYRSVILINDDSIDLFNHERLIKKSGFAERVYPFEEAEGALTFLKAFEATPEKLPDLIFLDMHMPGIDGTEFLELYAKLSDTIKRKCIIITLTLAADADDYSDAINNPYVLSYIRKPMDMDELFAITV